MSKHPMDQPLSPSEMGALHDAVDGLNKVDQVQDLQQIENTLRLVVDGPEGKGVVYLEPCSYGFFLYLDEEAYKTRQPNALIDFFYQAQPDETQGSIQQQLVLYDPKEVGADPMAYARWSKKGLVLLFELGVGALRGKVNSQTVVTWQDDLEKYESYE